MSIGCIIVCFHPQQALLRQLLESVLPQVDLCIVVDNGSSEDVRSMVEPYAGPRVILIPLADNLGVGAALNHGIEAALARGMQYLLLLDQDSLPAPTMVAELLAASRDLEASGVRVAAVGPRLVDRTSGAEQGFVRFGVLRNHRVSCAAAQRVIPADFVVTSGSLIPAGTLRALGLMDAGLFIDHVDTEWLLRARARDFRVFGACGAVLKHDIGEFRTRLPLGGVTSVPIHKAFRYFYVFRNSILLYRRKYVPWSWVLLDVSRLLRIAGFMLLMHPSRVHSLRMMVRGVAAGLAGRSGPLR